MKLSESQALARAAAYCSRGERSVFDVKKKLCVWELDEESIERILARLKKEKFLDEARFCDSFIRDKMRFNKWGRIKITFELKRKQVASSLIESAFENLTHDQFEEILFQGLQSKMKTIKAENTYQLRTKLIRFGLGRGYAMEQVMRCVNKLITNADEKDFY